MVQTTSFSFRNADCTPLSQRAYENAPKLVRAAGRWHVCGEKNLVLILFVEGFVAFGVVNAGERVVVVDGATANL